ncbi:cuticle collagen 2C-like [Agelaius tricolor]|uniref:cuticle collagen 2C-like n=1 Tax=Agelaius tricolor TaxID=9191 RepID=UPI0039F23E13
MFHQGAATHSAVQPGSGGKTLRLSGLRSAWNLEAARFSPKPKDVPGFSLPPLPGKPPPPRSEARDCPASPWALSPPSQRGCPAGAPPGPRGSRAPPRQGGSGGRTRAGRTAGSRISSDGDADPGGPTGADSARWQSPPSPGRGAVPGGGAAAGPGAAPVSRWRSQGG